MKRITSFLLAIIMLVCLIPADLAYAEGEKKLNVVLLNDGQYLIKLSGVDYAMARQATRKKDINPTDNPDDFEERTITVDISDIVIATLEADGTKVDNVTITVTCGDANYSKEYILTKNNFGENGGIDVPVPVEDYFPQIYVKFSDGRDSRYLVEAKSKPHQVVNITIDFIGHTGVATRWYGDTTRPDVEANYIGLNKSAHKFTLPRINQNTVLRSPSNIFQWRGYDNIVTLPVVPEADIRANGIETAKKFHLEIQDALQGQLANSKYYYQITGESYTPRGFTATMREKNTVDFDAGDGTWKTAKPAQQFAANGLKLSESFMEAPDTIGPVTVPNGDNDLTPPTVEAGKPAKKFVGWSTTKNGTKVDMATFVVTGDVTFYALYAEEEQGKVKVKYKDSKTNAAIDSKYQLKGQEYPAEKTGDMGKAIKDEVFDTNKAPKFLGYKIKSITTDPVPNPPATANYTKNGDYTVIYTYDKLDDIIPEKKNGNDNPDVTPDVKEHYAKVTYQVATDDSEKAKLQLADADATSPLVYYVNPLEGKTIAEVASVKAVSKDDNLYKVDANDMWTYDPDSITGTDQVISQLRDAQDNVIKTEITLTAKVADTDAKKYGDKLKAKDIVKWVEDTVEWKDGVEPITGVTFKSVADQSSRNTNAAGVFLGKLKVTFNDDSTAEIENQKLIVREKKADKKKPEGDDPGTYPTDSIEVKFVAGNGIKELNPANKVMVLQKDEKLAENDYPTVTLKDNFKTKTKNTDYYDVQPNTTLAAKVTTVTATAEELGKGSVNIEYWVDGVKLDDITKFKLPGKTYITSKQGTEDADVKATDLTSDYFDLLGYEKDTSKGTDGIEVEANTKYLTSNPGTVKFHYKKIDDIVGPVRPDDNTPQPAGYVTITFLADNQNPARGNFGADGEEVEYYVNPKTVTIDLTNQKLLGKDKDNAALNKDFPTLTVTDNKVLAKKQNGTQQWDLSGNSLTNEHKLSNTNTGITLRALYEGKPVVVPGPDQPKKPGTQDVDDEYVKIEFDKGTGKDLVGTTIYWVLKNSTIKDIKAYKEVPAGKTKEEVVFNIPTASKDGFTWAGWTADEPAGNTVYDTKLSDYKAVIKKNVKFTAEYKEKLVRPTDPDDPRPENDEVTVIFQKGEHGTLTGIVLNIAGEEVISKGKDKLAYNVKKKATWAAMTAYIPTAEADYGWRVANPSWKPVLPDKNQAVLEGTFTAQYVAKPTDRYITLTLDENYRGGRISDYDAYQGALIEGYLYRPHRRGYVFEGWSYNSRRLDEVRPGDRIYDSITLYAIWSKQKAKDDEEVEPIDTREVGEHKAYMFGYTDGTVRPNGYITRAEAAALVTRLLGLDTFASAAEPAFTDTPSSWYNKAINAAVQRGIMKGYPDKSFRPNAPITRAEFTQMISTIDNKPYGVAPFADVVGHWAERPIGSEYQAGRIKGYPDGTFRPNAFITRAEAVVILNKIFERNYDAMSAINAKNKEYIKRFIDLAPSFWGFNDMVEATNTHLFKRRVKGAVQEDWTLVK